jgi:16S rRNA (uracil1498-N3)-methyltransferase
VTAALRKQPGRLVFVGNLDNPALEPGDHHHLVRVLRVRPGDPMVLSDGAGRWRAAVFGQTIEPVGEVRQEARTTETVGVAFAPVKGDRPEWVVQKATELGVDHIRPMLTARSVVRWDPERAARQVDRWTSVAREAAMQCRRVWLPEVHPVADFDTVASLPGAVLADADGGAWTGEERLVLIGPEGGWTDDERSACSSVVLSTYVLRAETAALVAATYLTGLPRLRHG